MKSSSNLSIFAWTSISIIETIRNISLLYLSSLYVSLSRPVTLVFRAGSNGIDIEVS